MKALNLANSSTENERKDSDFYPTPDDVTQALINSGLIPKGRLWEPACGEGHMAEVFKRNGYQVIASDIRDTGYGTQTDFLTSDFPRRTGEVDWGFPIVTNPPFFLAEQFIKRCADLHAPVFALLLKSQYWHALKRIPLFEKYPPAYVLPLTFRPDFCFGDRGGAPTMECIWTVWIEGETDTRYRLLKKPETQQSLF